MSAVLPAGTCCVCRKADDVACYPDEGAGKTYCPTCCGVAEKDDGEQGHQFDYDKDERDYICRYCGERAPRDWMADHDAP